MEGGTGEDIEGKQKVMGIHFLKRIEVTTIQNVQRRKPVRAHSLAKVEIKTGQDAERKHTNKSHSLPEERGQEQLEYENKEHQLEVLTVWKRHILQ